MQIVIVRAIAGITVIVFLAFPSESTVAREQNKSGPLLHDAGLAVELVSEGLESPRSMNFLGDGSILVLQKDGGLFKTYRMQL